MSFRAPPRLLMAAILLAAHFMRIAVPQGWMPMQTADGWRITLCSGSGPMEMAPQMAMPVMHAMPQGHDHRPDHGTAEHPCAFSALAMALAEPVAPTLDVPAPLPVARPAGIALAVTIGRGLAAPPPPATGPPAAA
jgi:hypothetical protein